MRTTAPRRAVHQVSAIRRRFGVALLLLALPTGLACGGASARSPTPTGKVAPELAAWLRHAAPGARVGVVADFVNRPRAVDLLALGLSDCLADTDGSSGPDSPLSFEGYDLRHPAPAFGEMCVGHPTREAVLRLVDNSAVTSLGLWDNR
jgi:hypothetical protein